MPTPIIIDTDAGVDDAVAIALALAADDLAVAGLVSVGGNVPVEQATRNLGRLLAGLPLKTAPPVACGLDQEAATLKRAAHVFGADGLGESALEPAANFTAGDYLDLYERLIATHGADLQIVAIGPLTNLAAVLKQRPGLLERVGKIVVMGGAIWSPGNVTEYAEFNFYRDAAAAAAVLSSGLSITVVPLDVTRQVALDESHVAHLMRSGTATGEILAPMIQYCLGRGADSGPRQFIVHDAIAIGLLLWPELFMRARMALDITTKGEQVGRCRPKVAKKGGGNVAVAISINAGAFLENLLEQLCHEKFVV